MITVLHRGGLANDYSIPWILGCYIRNIISKDLTKKNILFSVGKKSFLGGMSKLLQLYIGGGTAKWLQYYIGGVCPNDYNITWGGVSRDPQKWLRNMCTTPKWRGGQFIFWYPLRFFQRCIKGYPDMRCISLLSHKEVWEWPLSPKYPTFAKNAEHHAAQTARHDSFHHFYENIEGNLGEDVFKHKYLD